MKPISLSLTGMVIFLGMLALSQDLQSGPQTHFSVQLTISCSNTAFYAGSRMELRVQISNNSTNTIGLAQPICKLEGYEIFSVDASGNTNAILTKPARSGRIALINAVYELYPQKTVACLLEFSLPASVHSGKHKLFVKRQCVVFKMNSEAKVISTSGLEIASEALSFEVK